MFTDGNMRKPNSIGASSGLEGRSYKEISTALGIPVATVGTKLLRVRRKLQSLLA